jgi:hypothetical protein
VFPGYSQASKDRSWGKSKPILELNVFYWVDIVKIRLNQLPVSSARWQHGSKICSETYISSKITKLLIAEQPPKLKKNKFNIVILRFLECFNACLTKFKNNPIVINKIATNIWLQSSYIPRETFLA